MYHQPKKKKAVSESEQWKLKLKFLPACNSVTVMTRMEEEEEWAEHVEREWELRKQQHKERMIAAMEHKELENKQKATEEQAWRDAHAKEMEEIIEFEEVQARMEETPAERLC